MFFGLSIISDDDGSDGDGVGDVTGEREGVRKDDIGDSKDDLGDGGFITNGDPIITGGCDSLSVLFLVSCKGAPSLSISLSASIG